MPMIPPPCASGCICVKEAHLFNTESEKLHP